MLSQPACSPVPFLTQPPLSSGWSCRKLPATSKALSSTFRRGHPMSHSQATTRNHVISVGVATASPATFITRARPSLAALLVAGGLLLPGARFRAAGRRRAAVPATLRQLPQLGARPEQNRSASVGRYRPQGRQCRGRPLFGRAARIGHRLGRPHPRYLPRGATPDGSGHVDDSGRSQPRSARRDYRLSGRCGRAIMSADETTCVRSPVQSTCPEYPRSCEYRRICSGVSNSAISR